MIRVEGLRKTYGDFPAVVGSDFEVDRGEIFGIVGPNGAGKTTTLKMLAGLVDPTGGTAEVAGRKAGDPAMRRELGFLPEESPLYEDMTPRSYLQFFADLYDVPRKEATERTEATLDRLELEHRGRRLGDMSKGMKRKVAIARSLVNDPDLLIYDEPASGLDPLTTNYVLEFTRELADQGKTVLFSAHNLYHVESICDRIVIMNRGEIIARGTVAEIRDAYGDTDYHVFTTVPVEGAAPDRSSQSATTRYRTVVDDMDAVETIRERAAAAGGEVVDIRTREQSLEDIFLELARETPPAAAAGEGREPAERRGGEATEAAAGGQDSDVDADADSDTDAGGGRTR
ncbi:ABC transporter ATP-binding protein [Halobellus sp. Atlit-31R]|nr:ABC transporter ATP-binding protein [Halobellus sp. Atlit-31R]